MRLINHGFDKSAVFLAEKFHRVVSVSQSWLLGSDQESVELLLLVSRAVFLNNNFLRKMHQEFISENFEGVILFTAEVSEDGSSLSSSGIIVNEDLRDRFNVS